MFVGVGADGAGRQRRAGQRDDARGRAALRRQREQRRRAAARALAHHDNAFLVPAEELDVVVDL